MTTQPMMPAADAPAAVASAAPAAASGDAALLEQVVVGGDLSKLTPGQRLEYYRRVCESLGLNPLTKPFDYLVLNGRLTLYATRTATDQLRASRGISISITSREMMPESGLYVVTARATDRDGRTDEAVGAVSIAGLRGESLANALMKAETKAKRRATLSLAGLGWMDETEAGDVPGARPARVDRETGEIIDGAVKPETSQVVIDRDTWQALAHALKANGLTKADLLAFLRAEVGETPLGATAQVREWFRRNPDADVIALVAEVYRYKLASEEEQA